MKTEIIILLVVTAILAGCDYDPSKYETYNNQTNISQLLPNITISQNITNMTWSPPNITNITPNITIPLNITTSNNTPKYNLTELIKNRTKNLTKTINKTIL